MWDWSSVYWAGIFIQSIGARNRVGIGLSYRPARLHRLAELIDWNRFLGSLKVKNFGLSMNRDLESIPFWSRHRCICIALLLCKYLSCSQTNKKLYMHISPPPPSIAALATPPPSPSQCLTPPPKNPLSLWEVPRCNGAMQHWPFFACPSWRFHNLEGERRV